jgi:hypothetical protein
MKTKSDPPPPEPLTTKAKVVNLRPEDQERIALAMARTGIGNETDVIRHALAKLCEQWEPTAKGGAK